MSSIQTCIYEYAYTNMQCNNNVVSDLEIVSTGAGKLPKIPYAVDLIAISII